VIVHRDSEIPSFEELRGKSWAYNEPLSHSGYGITRFHLVELGETNGFFGEVVEAGFHENAIRMVADGVVDGSAIDSQVLAIEMRDHPELRERLRVVASLGPSTIQPVTVTKRFDPVLTGKVQEVLLKLHRHSEMKQILADGLIDRFVAVDDRSYDDIRMMLDACGKADFHELR
jgi:phosphonate transport system substrate-binding protein